MANDKVLVTGATGFLGHHLIQQLVVAGYTIRALVRETSDTRHLRELGVELAHGDIQDAPSVNAAMHGCRYVVHAAGLFRFWGDVRAFERTNTEGTAYVLEAARRHDVEKLIHISTVVVIGNPPANTLLDETTPCKPADAYQRSKLDGENMVRMFHKTTRLPAVILRPGAFYGPFGRYAFNRLFFEDPLKGLLIKIHGGQRLTFPAYVPDVARAIVSALKLGRPGEIYNISGESLPHNDVNRIVSKIGGIVPFRLNIPAGWMLTVARRQTQQAERTGHEPYYPLNLANYVFNDWRVSSAKARAELGFVPTPFEEGARQTLEWYWNAGIFKKPAGYHPLPTPMMAMGGK
jgi:dihydroflavonol-4-reductase